MIRKYIRKKIKKYSDHNFQLAIESVANGCSIHEVSNKFHIHYTILNSYVNNEVIYDQAGRPVKFSREGESYPKQPVLILQVKKFLFLFSLLYIFFVLRVEESH